MSDGLARCPHDNDVFDWSMLKGFTCPTCGATWDGHFPIAEHTTPAPVSA